MQESEIQKNEQEVIRRLESFRVPEVTNLLYDFGLFLVKEEVAREERIDSKARAVAGFSGAILALIASTYPVWAPEVHSAPPALFLFVGGLMLAAAAFCATQAFGISTFQWFDEKDTWFGEDYLNDPDRLKKYYLVGMFRVVVSHSSRNADKTAWLGWAEAFLKVGGAAAIATIILALAEKLAPTWP